MKPFYIGRVDVTRMVSRRCEKAGLGHLSAHSMRHTAARMAEREGFTISELMSFTGHKNSATLLIYLQALTEAAGDVAAKLARGVEADLED